MKPDYQSIDFGDRIAEDEEGTLQNYFLKTSYWNSLIKGEVDVILGSKGSGKSALYIHLLDKEEELKIDRNIFLLKAENPRGDTIFSLFNKITATETYKAASLEFLIEQDIVAFWKLYFLTIIVTDLKKLEYDQPAFEKIINIFEECGLIPEEKSLKNIFRHVVHYLKQIVTLQAFQAEVDLDTHSGIIKTVKGKIAFDELSPKKIKDGHLTLDDLFSSINNTITKSKNEIWIAIDRLDIAFQENPVLEKRALKALFLVYNSLKSYSNISLKIFLRDDIWRKITVDGFREASHITRKRTISWDNDNTFFLILKRVVKNKEIRRLYDCHEDILKDIDLQKELFYKIFPEKIALAGNGDIPTFLWMLEVLKDSNGLFTPREVIHLLNETNNRQEQFNKYGKNISSQNLYSSEALLKSFREVAKTKYEQTLLAENPNLADMIDTRFRYADEMIDLEFIKDIFGSKTNEEAYGVCDIYIKAGFLKRLNMNEYIIPHLYREVFKDD